MPSQVVVLSLPSGAAPGSLGEPETRLKNWIQEKVGAAHGIASVALPDLKIGTLDNLVVQSEEVARIDSVLQQVVGKVHEVVVSVHDGDEAQVVAAEQVDGRAAWQYLQQFGWNTARYRPDRPISALLETLASDAQAADADLRARYTAYTTARTNLAAVDRKATGDLSVRSLDQVVKRSDVVVGSEYLQSVLLAVPEAQVKAFWASYETLAPMVVPRSARVIAAESDFSLFAVTVFRKHADEFVHKAREQRWVPRDWEFTEDGAASAEQERASLATQERRLRNEIVRLAAAAFSDVIKAWGHIKVIRLFVESVLRYGLPPTFITAAFVPERGADKATRVLVEKFAYLGGNAVGKDARGRPKDDADLTEYGAVVEHDYKPFVVYHMDLP